jgi:hypothetical protein
MANFKDYFKTDLDHDKVMGKLEKVEDIFEEKLNSISKN